MAKLTVLPGKPIIRGFKGVIDYYVYMDIPCARKWPNKRRNLPSPAEIQQTLVFAQAAQAAKLISPEVRQAYQNMAASTNMTWKDIFFRGYISGTLRYFYAPDDLEES